MAKDSLLYYNYFMKHVPETKRLTFTGAAGADSVYPEDQISHEEI